jgi:hypothetical protein
MKMPDPLKNLADGAVQINRTIAKGVSDLNMNAATAVETMVQGAASLVPSTPSVSTGQNEALSIPISPLNLPETFGVMTDSVDALLGGGRGGKSGGKKGQRRKRRVGPFRLSEGELAEGEPQALPNIGALTDDELAEGEDVPQQGDVRIH